MRIYAALIGCPFDTLWQRERRARTTRLLSLAGAVVAFLAVFLIIVLNQNARIEEQNLRLQSQLSKTLVDSGLSKLKDHDIDGALTDGINALENEDPSVYDHRAVKMLSDALCSYKYGSLQTKIIYDQSLEISSLNISDDEAYAFITDKAGNLSCIDLINYDKKWDVSTKDEKTCVYTNGLDDCVIYASAREICCLSSKDGSAVWSYEHQDHCENYFQAISEDGRFFAAADVFGDEPFDTEAPVSIVILNTKDGSTLGKAELDTGSYALTGSCLSDTLYSADSYAAAFSSDNSTLACMLPTTNSEDEPSEAVFVIDLDPFETHFAGVVNIQPYVFYGMDVSSSDKSIMFAGYSESWDGIRTGLIRKNGDSYDLDDLITGHDIRTPDEGFDVRPAFNRNACHFLSNDDRFIIFSDDDMMVFDKRANRLMRSYAMNDTIVSAYWTDPSKTSFDIILADGNITQFRQGEDDTYVFSEIYTIAMDQDKVTSASALNGGLLQSAASGMCISAGGEDKNQLLLTRYVTGSGMKDLSFKEVSDLNKTNALLFSEGSDTALCLYNGSDIFSFDRKTGDFLRKAHFEDPFDKDDIVMIDDDHFLSKEKLYGLDGSVSYYCEPFFEDDDGAVYPATNIMGSDGSVYSAIACANYNILKDYMKNNAGFLNAPFMCLVAKDGIPTDLTLSPETTLMLDNDPLGQKPVIAGGSGGQITAYGLRVTAEDHKLIRDDTSKFHFFDPASGTIASADDLFPESEITAMEAGNTEPVAAVLYENGQICLYSSEGGRPVGTENAYAEGEVQVMGFSENDEYLIVLTIYGRLDIYDSDSLEQITSQVIDLYHDYYTLYDSNSLYSVTYDSIHAVNAPDESRLMVMAGFGGSYYCTVLDTTTWTSEAEFDNVLAYDKEYNMLYFDADSVGIRTCPLFSAKDLKAIAEKETG